MFPYYDSMSQSPSEPVDPADAAPTPTDLIVAIRRQRRAVAQGEARVLELAVEWAHAHPELDDQGRQIWWKPGKEGKAYAGSWEMDEDGSPVSSTVDDLHELEWFGIPQIRWDCAASFSAANHMSTTGGRAYLRDALILCHRLPGIYRRTLTGAVPVHKARKIAQACIGKAPDVVEYLDAKFAPIADTSGLVTVDRMLAEAELALHPEQAEHDRLDALQKRSVFFDRDQDLTLTNGLAEMVINTDWADLAHFDLTINAIAEALKHTEEGEDESLDTRRALAVGVLADPDRAAALLAEHETTSGTPRRTLDLIVHLTADTLRGASNVATGADGRVFVADQVRDWAARPDTHITVRGLIDLTPTTHEHEGEDHYRPSKTLSESVVLRDQTCVFPFCRRPAKACDLDHICPFRESGRTCECNLAPLCRHHHQLKTHAGWRYRPIEPGVYLWSDTHGQRFLRTPDGTVDQTSDPDESFKRHLRVCPPVR